MATAVFPRFIEECLNNTWGQTLNGHATIAWGLMTSTGKTNLNTIAQFDDYDNWDDIDAYEIAEPAGTSYQDFNNGSGPLLCTNVAVAVTTDKVTVSMDDLSCAAAAGTIAAYGLVLYYYSGTDTTSNLIAWYDFGDVKTVTNGTFTIEWTGGIAFDLDY